MKKKKKKKDQKNKQIGNGEGILTLENIKIENLKIEILIIDLQIAFSYPPSSAS